MDAFPDRIYKIALVTGRSAPLAGLITHSLDEARDFLSYQTFENLDSLDDAPAILFDILLAGLDVPGIRELLASEATLPLTVLLTQPGDEAEALGWFQSGRVGDYILAEPSQLRRLPYVIKAAAMRRAAQHQARTLSLQETIYQIAAAAEAAASLDDLLPEIHRIIGRVMPADNFYIALYDPDHESLRFPYFVDEREILSDRVIPMGNGLTEFVLRGGRSLLCPAESQQHLALKGTVEVVGPPSAVWLGVPLFVNGVAIGVMAVQHYHDRSAYGEVEQRMLEFVSTQVASVIHRKRMYEALRASEESFRGVFENATIGLLRAAPDGRILLANTAMARMLGFENFEGLAKGDFLREGPIDERKRAEFLARMDETNEVRGMENVWQKADGSLIYVRESARAVRDGEGRILYFEAVVEDITDHKLAEAAVREKVAALRSLAEIDREILAAEDDQAILSLVCRRIAELLKAPKSAIVAVDQDSRRHITAFHGLLSREKLNEYFNQAIRMGMLEQWTSQVIPDCSTAAGFMPAFSEQENICALIVEPFRASANSLGALIVCDTIPRNWTSDETHLVRLLAGQAALALEKIRLLTDARRRADESSILYQVAAEIMSRRDLSSVLRLVVNNAASFYKVPNSFIYLYDPGQQEVVLSVVSNPELPLGATLKVGEGMAGRVVASLQPMILENYSEWEGRAPLCNDHNVMAVLEVPMLYGGKLIGVLGIESMDSLRKFGENVVDSLSLLAEQAASAVYNARLFSEIEDRNRELDRLARASSTLLAGVSSDIPTLSRSIANLLASEFHNSHCCVWLIRDDGLTLDRAGVAGPFVELIKPALLTTKGPGIIARAIRTRRSINIGEVQEFQDYIAGWEETRSELVVPLRAGDRILGAIDLQNQSPAAYSDDDVRLIELIASQAALLVEHVRLYQQTDRRLNQLTALSNIDAAIASTLDLQVTLNTLVSQISTHLQTDAVDVMLLNPHLRMLEYAAGRGFHGNAIRRVPLLLGEDQAGTAALERTIVSVFDLTTALPPLQHPERIAGEDFVSMSAVPLIAKGQVKGVLELFYRRPVESSPDWINFLEILARQAAIAVEDASLFNDMQHSFTELAVAYDASIEGWARVLQMRHHEPEELTHSLTALTLEMARRMGISEAEMSHIYRGVLLHDIGKLDIPEDILFKRTPLTTEEWELIRRHPAFAYDFLQSIAYLRPAMNIPYCHHENWDGSGYPRGLKGKDIPLEARIFSVVNAWVILQTGRPYRPAWDRDRAVAYLREQAGRQFDPEVVSVFMEMIHKQD